MSKDLAGKFGIIFNTSVARTLDQALDRKVREAGTQDKLNIKKWVNEGWTWDVVNK